MLNCTNHFNQRWTERVVGIRTEAEIKQYINDNRDKISEHANKTFEFAEKIWSGQLGDNVTRNYFIKDDIVFITNTENNAFITTYKVDLGFTDELNSIVRRGLMDEIERLKEIHYELEFEKETELSNKEHEASTLLDEIGLAKEFLDNLKNKKRIIDEEVKLIKTNSIGVGIEIKQNVMKLVNSKEYKEDLLNMKK